MIPGGIVLLISPAHGNSLAVEVHGPLPRVSRALPSVPAAQPGAKRRLRLPASLTCSTCHPLGTTPALFGQSKRLPL
jgi:hypothetical protein